MISRKVGKPILSCTNTAKQNVFMPVFVQSLHLNGEESVIWCIRVGYA